MKLVNKFTLWFFAVTSVVLVTGGVITFRIVQREMNEETAMRLINYSDNISNSIRNGTPISYFLDKHVSIKEINILSPALPLKIIDTVLYFPMEGTERSLMSRAVYSINDKKYLVEISEFILDPHEITLAVIESVIWIFLIFIIIIILVNWQISQAILRPLKKTLRVIQSFNLKQQGKIKFENTNVHEFSELNYFLEQMTNKAINDYLSLKEFTENSSHELQTPLAIIRGKLELLMESGVNSEQAKLIMPAYEATEKLSRINHSLNLLTKIENHQYIAKETINLSLLLENELNSFSELIEMKSLSIKKEIQKDVLIKSNLFLAEILLSNLLSNAIRHNSQYGYISIFIDAEKFIIQNTGIPPKVPTQQLFNRFKKGNQNSESIGLGLSIVKQICDLQKFEIKYSYSDKHHLIQIVFGQ